MSDQTPKPSQKLADPDPLEAEILRREGPSTWQGALGDVAAAQQLENRDAWTNYTARASQNATPRPYLDSYQLQDWAVERFQRLESRLFVVEKWLWLTATACIVLIFMVVGLVWRLL